MKWTQSDLNLSSSSIDLGLFFYLHLISISVLKFYQQRLLALIQFNYYYTLLQQEYTRTITSSKESNKSNQFTKTKTFSCHVYPYTWDRINILKSQQHSELEDIFGLYYWKHKFLSEKVKEHPLQTTKKKKKKSSKIHLQRFQL